MKKNTSKTKKRTTTAEAREKFASFVGIDLGDKHCEVCVFNGAGEVQERLRLPMKGKDLEGYFGKLGRSRVALEAGGQSRWVAEVIERCGHEVYVSNVRKVAYISASDDKDDPGDAYKLAELVHFKPQLLHPIQHRSREAQADLSWIRAREALVESRSAGYTRTRQHRSRVRRLPCSTSHSAPSALSPFRRNLVEGATLSSA